MTAVLEATLAREKGGRDFVDVWLGGAPKSADTQLLAQALEAHRELDAFWKVQPSDAPMSDVQVVLFQRFTRSEKQQGFVEENLRDLRFRFFRQQSGPDQRVAQGGASVLLYGADVPLKDLQAVALALIRASVPVVQVYRWGRGTPNLYPAALYNAGLKSISVVAAAPPAAGNRPPLTVEQFGDEQALEAHIALNAFWEVQPSNAPERFRDAQVVLFQRFTRSEKQQGFVEEALKDGLRFRFQLRRDQRAAQDSASVLLAGADVPLKDLQAVALALIRARVPVVEIYRWGGGTPDLFPAAAYNAGVNSISVVAVAPPAEDDRKSLAVKQIVDEKFKR